MQRNMEPGGNIPLGRRGVDKSIMKHKVKRK
jgi:hypothetical protein